MQTKEALEGVKVLELSWAIAGPWLGSYLGAFGAEVVKIESATAPDVNRLSAPYKDGLVGLNRSGLFNANNTNKYSMALDLDKPEGLKIARRLAVWADVVIDGFALGMLERWGLGYEQVKTINPGVIMLSATLEGRSGPEAAQRGLGHNLVSLAGYSHLTGWPDREPVGTAVAYTDWIAPLLGVAAIMAALAHKRKTGSGEFIEVSQYEVGVAFISQVLLQYITNGQEANRDGNRSDHAVPHGVYRCKGEDRWCAISVSNDEQWKSFCHAIGDPVWTRKADFATMLGKKKNEDELDRLVETWTIDLSAETVREKMQAVGVAAGVVNTTEDIMDEDAHLKERGLFWVADHPETGPGRYIRPVALLSTTPAKPRMPAPCLGENTEYVCREILRMPDEEFVELLNKGIFV